MLRARNSRLFVLLVLAGFSTAGVARTVTEIIFGPNLFMCGSSIAVDDLGNVLGNVYVSGYMTNNAFKITPEGEITEIIDSLGAGPGKPLAASTGIAVDDLRNVYITGYGSNNAFKVTPDGVITEIINAEGAGPLAPLVGPYGIAVDDLGNAYVPGATSSNAFKITPEGEITEIINSEGAGPGKPLAGAFGIAVDYLRNVFVTGASSNNAFKITPDGVITEIINAEGAGPLAPLVGPYGIAVDDLGNAYVPGATSSNAFKITPAGVITEVINANDLPEETPLNGPAAVAVDEFENIYVTGQSSNNAFKVEPPYGAVNATEIIDHTGDGMGNELEGPGGIAAGNFGNAYITGFMSSNAFKIEPQYGAANATKIIDHTGDNVGHDLVGPDAIAVDDSDNVYLTGLSSSNGFKITGDGEITEIFGPNVDGQDLLLAFPYGIAVDAWDNVYVTGGGPYYPMIPNNVVMFTPSEDGYNAQEIINADDLPEETPLYFPYGIAADDLFNVYVTGFASDNVFKIEPPYGAANAEEIIGPDGAGPEQPLDGPMAIAVDDSHNVYVAATDSDNVFKIEPPYGAANAEEIIGPDCAGPEEPLLDGPNAIALDGSANVNVNVTVTGFYSDNAFRIEPPYGCGNATQIIGPDGAGSEKPLREPRGIDVDNVGNVYVTGGASHNAFQITLDGVITEIIDWTGDELGNTLVGSFAIAVDNSRDVYITGYSSDNAFKIELCNTLVDYALFAECLEASGPGVVSGPSCACPDDDADGDVDLADFARFQRTFVGP